MNPSGDEDDRRPRHERRVACAAIIDAPRCALVRREPTAFERCLAIASDDTARATLLSVSPAARAAGVRRGQRVHRARAIAPSLIVRVDDPRARAAAREALYDAASSLAASIEPDGDRVFVDARGVRALHESERGFASSLARACEKVGLVVSVAVASGKRTAGALAEFYSTHNHDESHVLVVEAERERAALSSLSLSSLGLSPSRCAALEALGVRTAGALAALDPTALGDRLGLEVAEAARVARGEDRSPLLARPRQARFEEGASFDWEVSESEPLLFLCKALFDQGLARLACRSLASREARVALALRDRSWHERALRAGAATRESAVWLRLLRASLEAAPPPQPVVGARVLLIPCAARASQLGLFDPPGPAPERWSAALARIEATVGPTRVGAPREPATHRPREVRLTAFEPDVAKAHAADRACDARATSVPLALHVFRPPRPARVRVERGAIVAVSFDATSARVLRSAGPYRRSGHWWDEPFEEDSWDVALEDHTILRLSYDRRAAQWIVEGRYE